MALWGEGGEEGWWGCRWKRRVSTDDIMAGRQDGAHGLHVLVSGFCAPLCELLPPHGQADRQTGRQDRQANTDKTGQRTDRRINYKIM